MEVRLQGNGQLYHIYNAGKTCVGREAFGEAACMITSSDVETFIQSLIDRGHHSVLEHVNYTFFVKGISRDVLQELARHRIASLSVKSTRYTLKELVATPVEKLSRLIKETGNIIIDGLVLRNLMNLKETLEDDRRLPNDVAKYVLPGAFKTNLYWTINARSLRNFFELRTSSRALAEIREMAANVYRVLPASHKFMYADVARGCHE